MNKWTRIPTDQEIRQTITALKERNINALVVDTGSEAKEKVMSLLPQGAGLLVTSSVTLETLGISDEVDNSKRVISVRKEYMALDHNKDAKKIKNLRSTPEIVIGSVQAVTKEGVVLIASNTGSQLASYVYGADKVIWVVGAQKIVEDLEEGNNRIYDYVVPLEDEHMQRLYGIKTNVSKLLIFNKEITKDRVTLIFVKESLGF